MLNAELTPGKSFTQRNFLLHEKISAFSLKYRVLINLNLDHNITGLNPWELIRLSREDVLLAIWSTFSNLNFNQLLRLHHFVSFASLAAVFVFNHLSLAMAHITRPGRLRIHPGSKLHHFSPHSAPIASIALLDSSILG